MHAIVFFTVLTVCVIAGAVIGVRICICKESPLEKFIGLLGAHIFGILGGGLFGLTIGSYFGCIAIAVVSRL